MITRLICFFVFGFGLLSIVAMVRIGSTPENLILGEWKGLTWEYEAMNPNVNDPLRDKEIPEEVKNAIGQSLVLHKAETWRFLPNGRLKLTGNDTEQEVEWRIKGRGNILQIRYDNGTAESYILTELTSEKMNLNFETDIQARGIAKLSFEKVNH